MPGHVLFAFKDCMDIFTPYFDGPLRLPLIAMQLR